MNDNKGQNTTINWYPGHMAKAKRQMIEQLPFVDIVFEVIDARMPYSSKVRDIQNILKNKICILIMTKIDLCDKIETQKWICHYEQEGYHVVPVNLEKKEGISSILKKVKEVMKEKNKKNIEKGLKERRARVMVLGIPNVGKSTLINCLVGKKTAEIGNRPGITKEVRWIRAGSEIELLDTPGILWPKLDNETVAINLASLSAIKEEILPLDDVAIYILKMLSTYYPDKMLERYGIKQMDDIEQSLELVAKKRGAFRRGGEVDYDRIYQMIVNDIKSGIIKEVTFDRFG